MGTYDLIESGTPLVDQPPTPVSSATVSLQLGGTPPKDKAY